jgi:RNA polymerase sigma-70 factor (ECF subfamily)
MPPRPDEDALIQRAQSGDKEAVGILYETYAQLIYQYISYRVKDDEIAEDLTADVFLRMVRGLPAYKQTGAPFSAWLYRIAANRITDFYRGNQALNARPIPEDYGQEPDLAERVVKEQERAQLRDALQTLPEEHQTVLILRFIQDLSHAEVAAVVGKSVEAVRVVQHRALKALAVALKNRDEAWQATDER